MPDSIINVFHQLKTILCICPYCNSMLRLSDLHLRDKGKAPKTFLDEYEIKEKKLGNKEEKIEDKESNFSKKEKEINEKAVNRGR